MDCLIIAAGRGSRLNGEETPKPLAKINNKTLVEYIIDTVISVSVDRIFVVTGYQSKKITTQLALFNQNKKAEIINLYNPLWDEGNGLSVLAAKNKIKSPFLLLMSDHLFIPEMLRQLINTKIRDKETILAVDQQIEDNPLVDLDDVTRVKINDNTIENIGKHIDDYNAFDTGMFLSSSYLFDAIEKSVINGDSSLSGGMRILRSQKLAKVKTIKKALWIDVDTPEMLQKAKKLINNGSLY